MPQMDNLTSIFTRPPSEQRRKLTLRSIRIIGILSVVGYGGTHSPFLMACKTRADVVRIMDRVEELIFTECQRGAFNTNAQQIEREAVKAVVRQARMAKMIVSPKKQENAMDAPLPLEQKRTRPNSWD